MDKICLHILLIKLLVLTFLMLFGSKLMGQCDCDHTVGLTERHFYGDDVAPGDVVCVEGGTRGPLRFHDVEGTEDNPVIIKNCGGQVLITATGGGKGNVALLMSGNKYFHLTGTGDPEYEYGFKLGGEAFATLDCGGRATNFEIDHIEIFSSGFAGMMLKTDPDGEERNVRPEDPDAVDGGFTMYDISVHDCYIHDCLPDGEGIYMGNSFWSSGKSKDGDSTDMQYPHSIYGAKIYNNIFERTGREAIQAGSVVSGLEIYNNEIYEYGYMNSNRSQNNGIQIGEGSSGKIYNNLLMNGPDGGSRGIYLLGLGDYYVYNNVVIGADVIAITANLRPSPLSGDPGDQGYLGGAYIINNTIIDTKGAQAFGTYLNDAPDNVLLNNLVITSNENWDGIIGGDWIRDSNLVFETEEEAGLVREDTTIRLLPTSDAIDAGMDVTDFNIYQDFTGGDRPTNYGYDVGALEFDGEVALGVSDKALTFKVYPNPISEKVIIEMQEAIDSGPVKISLLNTAGKELLTREMKGFDASDPIELNVSGLNLPAGIYYLKVESETHDEVQKVIRR